MAEPAFSYAHQVDTLLENVGDLLDSVDARDRVRAIHDLTAGVELLERQVVTEANEQAMSWAEIGRVYGVTRQSVHKRFASGPPVASVEVFDWLLSDEDDEAGDSLTNAVTQARAVVKNPAGVLD